MDTLLPATSDKPTASSKATAPSSKNPTSAEAIRTELLAEVKRITKTKDALIHAQEKRISELTAALHQARQAKHELARLTILLLDAERKLDAIKLSLSWKLLASVRSLQKIFSRVFSQGSLRVIEKSPLFDAEWYRKKNSGGCRTMSPAAHYLRKGAAKGLNPGPCFDTEYYLSQNPTVAARGDNPLVHYEKVGKKRGLSPVRRAA